jgi:hypothetical protein
MRASTSPLALLALALVANACGNSRPLAPKGSGGTGTAGSTSGAAGATATTGSAGATATTGAAGAMATGTGAAGAMEFMGAAGDTQAPSTPLPIRGDEALQRVANVLWHQEPDGAALAAAPAVMTKEAFQPIVRGMLADARSTQGVGQFFRWWLDLDLVATVEKDSTLFPELTSELRADMIDETITFGVNITLMTGTSGTYRTLMQLDASFINERLAKIYGIGGVTGDDLRLVTQPTHQRAGLLTQPSLQVLGSFATRTSPSHRGAEILRRFLCEAVPAAPPGIQGLPPPPPPGTTQRQALAASFTSPVCNACHNLIDPPGLAFEAYDAIGRWRTIDNGAPVDTSNLAIIFPRANTNGVTQVVNGPFELAFAVSNDPSAQDCYAQKWLEFALGRELTDADQPSLAQIEATYHTSGLNLQTLIVGVLTSDAFLAPT